jgi:hypothetical protein
MRNGIPALLTFVAFAPAAAALAHHAFSAEFDIDKPITLTGTVTKIEWMNPHAWFYIDVSDDLGNVSSWGMELGSPNLLMRAGWSRSALKVGDVVEVDAYRAKNGKNIANAKTVMITATGRVLGAGSSSGR